MDGVRHDGRNNDSCYNRNDDVHVGRHKQAAMFAQA